MDVNTTRPKQNIKQITHRDPLEVFEQDRLATKNKVASASKNNIPDSGKPIHQETIDALSKFKLQVGHLKLPQFPGKDNATSGAPIELSASEAELIKKRGIASKCSRHHWKDTALKQAQTSATVVLESIPSPTQGDNTPPDSDRDAPGANEDEQEFQHNDEQIAKSIQDSQKAHGTQDLEMVFMDVVHENGKRFRICQVCE